MYDFNENLFIAFKCENVNSFFFEVANGNQKIFCVATEAL